MMNEKLKDKFLIKLPCKLKDVLLKFDKNALGIVFVVDNNLKLLGSITDGDIRRAYLNKNITNIVRRSSKFINKKVFYLNFNSSISTILKYLSNSSNKNKFKCIPLVNNKRIVIDISTIQNLRNIPITNIRFGNEELNNVVQAVKSGWISSKGGFVENFENEFSKYLGGGYSLTTSSGTSALELGLKSLRIEPKDEVIVPNFSFAASINAILNVGARPVIVDIDKKTWTIDIKKLQKLINRKTKAIMPVHIYGQSCDMDKIMEISKKYKLKVIEDAAEALGGTYKGKLIGLKGDCSCFSFFANKTITTGEGGMVVFKDKKHYETGKIIRSHGMTPKKPYRHSIVGSNYRMTNLQASIGMAQLKKVNKLLKERKKVFEYYDSRLSHNKEITLLPKNNWSTNSYWLYTVLINKIGKIKRDKLISGLLKKGIETRPTFFPFNKMLPFKTFAKGSFSVSEEIAYNGISLPSNSINFKDQDYIIRQLLLEINKLSTKRFYKKQ